MVLDAICTGDGALDWPPLSIVIDPAGACRILRDRAERTDALWQLDRVPVGALSAQLHVLGRLPSPFVADLLDRVRAGNARIAWVGGDALPRELEAELDIVCVNAGEAARLLESERQPPRQSAEALARRARHPAALRVVTGAGAAPTAIAARNGAAVLCHEASPGDVAADEIRTLKGVGDVFAASFLASSCFDADGNVRAQLDVVGALHHPGRERTACPLGTARREGAVARDDVEDPHRQADGHAGPTSRSAARSAGDGLGWKRRPNSFSSSR